MKRWNCPGEKTGELVKYKGNCWRVTRVVNLCKVLIWHVLRCVAFQFAQFNG